MNTRLGTSRAIQIGMVALLVLCFAQAGYWVVDQAVYTRKVNARLLAAWDEGQVAVDPARVQQLERERHRRMNRYGWEGTFFLAVLAAGMGVISQALRQRSELARRQHNFLAAVSHEFKSPLASIKLAAETIALRRPAGEDLDTLTARMTQDVERLESMVANLLDAGRIEDGRLALARERVGLARELRALAAEIAPHAAVQRVQVDSDVSDGVAVRADPGAVRAVLSNLLTNAVKASAARGGGSVRVRARRDGRFVRVDVEDDGVGFEARERARLFEKFYRPGDELRRRTKGSGLGLFIVKHFVEAGGGRVRAESEGPGRGATFSVWWPAAAPEKEDVA